MAGICRPIKPWWTLLLTLRNSKPCIEAEQWLTLSSFAALVPKNLCYCVSDLNHSRSPSPILSPFNVANSVRFGRLSLLLGLQTSASIELTTCHLNIVSVIYPFFTPGSLDIWLDGAGFINA
jgi:hypothetical protein